MSVLGGNASMPTPPPADTSGQEADAAASAKARAERDARRRGISSLIIRPAGDYGGSPTGLSIGEPQ
jgi:hypothetical protein